MGSGNGSPGLVLALLREDIEATLLEPRQKRWAFLREAARAAGVRSVQVLRARHDEYDGPPARTLTVRALALPLAELGRLVRPAGRLIVFGARPEPVAPFVLERGYPGRVCTSSAAAPMFHGKLDGETTPRQNAVAWAGEAALDGRSEFEAGLLFGLLVGEGHFGGDGRQAQVTLRMHVRHEKLFRWLAESFPEGKLYGPYNHGGREYFQWMARGRFLREALVPFLAAAAGLDGRVRGGPLRCHVRPLLPPAATNGSRA